MAAKRKIICYIAISLDGYIATENDSLDWLLKTESEGDAGYAEFIDTIDTVIMGRRTYDWVMEMEKGDFPYSDKVCYVYTTAASGKNEYVQFTDETVKTFADKLKKQEGKNIWVVGGSKLLQQFMKEKLIDEFIISIAPTIIGKGIPLFQKLEFEIK